MKLFGASIDNMEIIFCKIVVVKNYFSPLKRVKQACSICPRTSSILFFLYYICFSYYINVLIIIIIIIIVITIFF